MKLPTSQKIKRSLSNTYKGLKAYSFKIVVVTFLGYSVYGILKERWQAPAYGNTDPRKEWRKKQLQYLAETKSTGSLTTEEGDKESDK